MSGKETVAEVLEACCRKAGRAQLLSAAGDDCATEMYTAAVMWAGWPLRLLSSRSRSRSQTPLPQRHLRPHPGCPPQTPPRQVHGSMQATESSSRGVVRVGELWLYEPHHRRLGGFAEWGDWAWTGTGSLGVPDLLYSGEACR